jgi:hypothetical protein
MEIANALAYYDMATVTSIPCCSLFVGPVRDEEEKVSQKFTPGRPPSREPEQSGQSGADFRAGVKRRPVDVGPSDRGVETNAGEEPGTADRPTGHGRHQPADLRHDPGAD